MSTANAVEKARALLSERRAELQAEIDEIDTALAAIGGGPKRRGPGRPRKGEGPATAAASTPRRRRRRGGTRAEHALRQITERPGLTATEIAGALGIKPNYVYRVMAELEKDGRARKQGKGYYPTEAAPPAAPESGQTAPPGRSQDDDPARASL